jgi:hypothetical protein
VIDGSSVAGSLRPRRGRSFEQHPKHNKRLCLFRAVLWSGALLSFYIKPADGYQLPEITRWMKQTFSCRFNIVTWRTGGDAFFQRGAVFAAAPWHGVQATPQAQQKVVPVSGAELGGARVWGPVLVGDSGGETAAGCGRGGRR